MHAAAAAALARRKPRGPRCGRGAGLRGGAIELPAIFGLGLRRLVARRLDPVGRVIPIVRRDADRRRRRRRQHGAQLHAGLHRLPPRPSVGAHHVRAVRPAGAHPQHAAESQRQLLRLRLRERQRRVLPRLPVREGRGVPRRTDVPRVARVHPARRGSGGIQRVRIELGARLHVLRDEVLPGGGGRMSGGADVLGGGVGMRGEREPPAAHGRGRGTRGTELHHGGDQGATRRGDREGKGRGGDGGSGQLVVRHVVVEHARDLRETMRDGRRLQDGDQLVGSRGDVLPDIGGAGELRGGGRAREGTGPGGEPVVRNDVERHARDVRRHVRGRRGLRRWEEVLGGAGYVHVRGRARKGQVGPDDPVVRVRFRRRAYVLPQAVHVGIGRRVRRGDELLRGERMRRGGGAHRARGLPMRYDVGRRVPDVRDGVPEERGLR